MVLTTSHNYNQCQCVREINWLNQSTLSQGHCVHTAYHELMDLTRITTIITIAVSSISLIATLIVLCWLCCCLQNLIKTISQRKVEFIINQFNRSITERQRSEEDQNTRSERTVHFAEQPSPLHGVIKYSNLITPEPDYYLLPEPTAPEEEVKVLETEEIKEEAAVQETKEEKRIKSLEATTEVLIDRFSRLEKRLKQVENQ